METVNVFHYFLLFPYTPLHKNKNKGGIPKKRQKKAKTLTLTKIRVKFLQIKQFLIK